MRPKDVTELAQVTLADIKPATITDVIHAYKGRVPDAVLEVLTQEVNETPFTVFFWRAGSRHYYDEVYFGEVVAIDDLDYNSEIGLHSKEWISSKCKLNI